MSYAAEIAELHRTLGGLRADRATRRANIISHCTAQGLDVWQTRHQLEAESSDLEAEIFLVEGELAALEALTEGS